MPYWSCSLYSGFHHPSIDYRWSISVNFFYHILRQTLTLYPMLSLKLMYCCCDIGTRSNMRKRGLFWLRVLGLESLVMRTAWQCWEEQKLADPISIGAQEAGCKEHRHELPTIPGFVSVFDDFKLLMCSYNYSLVKYIHFNIRRDVSSIAFWDTIFIPKAKDRITLSSLFSSFHFSWSNYWIFLQIKNIHN